MTQPNLTEDQGILLQHEEFISQVLAVRGGQRRASGWREFLKTSAAAALITVLGGGWISVSVTKKIQESAVRREFQNGVIKLYSEHQLLEQREFLEERRGVRDAALNLIGRSLSRGEARIAIDGPKFAHRRDPEQEKTNELQKQEIRRMFNEVLDQWNTRKETFGPSIGFFFGTTAEDAWGGQIRSLDSYLECATNHKPGKQEATGEHSCTVRLRETEADLKSLQAAMRHDEPRQWLTKEDVQLIRAILSEDH